MDGFRRTRCGKVLFYREIDMSMQGCHRATPTRYSTAFLASQRDASLRP